MLPLRLESLAEVFAQVPDRRDPRGIRHPLQGMLALVFLGLLARIREMAVLQRWAKAHWAELQAPLGFDRDQPPHATTISRTIAGCELSKFAAAFLGWVKTVVPDEPLTVAVDAKTSCQGLGEDGQPVQLLTVLVHKLKLVLAQWSVRGEKTNEPNVLKNHLAELTADFPLLKLITGDAIYAQRPLAEALLDENCDYLVQIKANQADVRDALEHCLGTAHERKPAAQTAEKKGTPWIGAGFGWI
jgi:DDE family transposase